jgi:hypothetical protein
MVDFFIFVTGFVDSSLTYVGNEFAFSASSFD